MRFNDGKIGPDGAFRVGTMDLNARDPIGVLYRMTATRTGDSEPGTPGIGAPPGRGPEPYRFAARFAKPWPA